MAIAPPVNLHTGIDSGGSVTNFTSPSLAVVTAGMAADGVVLIHLFGQDTSATYPTGINSPAGLGLTWRVAQFQIQTTGATRWFDALIVGTKQPGDTGPTNGTFTCTIASSSATRLGFEAALITSGADAASMSSWPVGGAQSASAAGLTPTVASADAAGIIFTTAGHRVQEGQTLEAGWTELADFGNTTPAYDMSMGYRAGSADLSAAWTWATAQTCAACIIAISPAVAPVPSRWSVAGLRLMLDGRRFLVKGMNVYAVQPYVGATGGDETGLYAWFANATNRANFARHLRYYGFTAIRLPVMNDLTTGYYDKIGAIGAALWAEGIATLVCPFDGQAQSVGGFGDNWPDDTVGGTNSAALACGQWLAAAWAYLGTPDWFLFDTYNEPNQGGSLTEADWLSGMEVLIGAARGTGYTGPIVVEGTGWSHDLPTNVGTLLAFDPQIIMESHRYATNDGSSQPALDGSDATVTWKAAWPDTASAAGVAILVGEFGPFNAGYGTGGATFVGNVSNWCRAMAGAIDQAVRRGHCVGSFAWTLLWDDDASAPANSLWLNNSTEMAAFEAGTNIPFRNLWGEVVYGMYRDQAPPGRAIRDRQFRERATTIVAVNTAARLRAAVRARVAGVHAAPNGVTRLRAAVRPRAVAIHAAPNLTTRLVTAVRAKASATHAAPNETARLRVAARGRVTSLAAHLPATRLRVAGRARADALGAHAPAARLRVAVRPRASALHATATPTTRLRGAVRLRLTSTKDYPAAARLRGVVRIRSTSLADHTPTVRLRAVARLRASAAHAAPNTTARLRAVLRVRAAATADRQPVTRLRGAVRPRAIGVHASPSSTARLRIAARLRAGATHAAPNETARLRVAARLRTAAIHAAPNVATKVRAVVRITAVSGTSIVVNTATRLRVAVRVRTGATHAAPNEAARVRVAVRPKATSAKGALSASRLRGSVRPRAAYVKDSPQTTRLRVAGRVRSVAIHGAQPTTRLRAAARIRATAVKGAIVTTRLRAVVRLRTATIVGRITATRLRVAARLRAVGFQIAPGQHGSSFGTVVPSRSSFCDLEPASDSHGTLEG